MKNILILNFQEHLKTGPLLSCTFSQSTKFTKKPTEISVRFRITTSQFVQRFYFQGNMGPRENWVPTFFIHFNFDNKINFYCNFLLSNLLKILFPLKIQFPPEAIFSSFSRIQGAISQFTLQIPLRKQIKAEFEVQVSFPKIFFNNQNQLCFEFEVFQKDNSLSAFQRKQTLKNCSLLEFIAIINCFLKDFEITGNQKQASKNKQKSFLLNF